MTTTSAAGDDTRSGPSIVGGDSPVRSARLGVLDVGSNTVHLLVVDAHRGAPPTAMTSEKTELRLAEQIDRAGRLPDRALVALVDAVDRATASAAEADCTELVAFATSALREATNSAAVADRVRAETGVSLQMMPGEDEARYTFLAARRWYGWSAGRMLVLDIGGGSLEVAVGSEEHPDVASSLPLGAGRLTQRWFTSDPPRHAEITALSEHVGRVLAPVAEEVRRAGSPTVAVGTSKTFRSLAQLSGVAPSTASPARPVLVQAELRQLLTFISRMSSRDLAELRGVSPTRAHQLLAGAVVAAAAMRALDVPEVQICPWALREGVIFRWLDALATAPTARPRRRFTLGLTRPRNSAGS